MADWYQRQGEYPYINWHDVSDSNIYPDSLWKQIEGDYPYRGWHDVSNSNIYPDNLWKQTDGIYPYRGWHDVSDNSIYPKYAGLWFQRDGNIPYMDWIDIPSIDTFPEMLWKQRPVAIPHRNWAKFPKLPSKAPEIANIEIVSPLLEYIIKNKGIYIQPDTESLNTELEDLIQERHDQGLDNVTMEELGDEYNSYINGNVDYNLRPFMKGSKVIPYGWEVEPDAIVSTIDMDYFIYDENDDIVYTVKVTPLMEDGTILTPEQLGNYVGILQDIVTTDGGDSTNILGYDAEHKKIIINIEDGESQYDSEGMTTLDHELDVVKQKHVILKRIEMIQNEISTMETTSRYLTYEIILEGES